MVFSAIGAALAVLLVLFPGPRGEAGSEASAAGARYIVLLAGPETGAVSPNADRVATDLGLTADVVFSDGVSLYAVRHEVIL